MSFKCNLAPRNAKDQGDRGIIFRWRRFNSKTKTHSCCVDRIPKSLEKASLAGPKIIAGIRDGVVAASTADVPAGVVGKNLYVMERAVPFTMSGIKIEQVARLAVCGRLG